MNKEFLDTLQSIVPYVQKAEATLMIMQKEGIKLKDINISETEITNINFALNTIKLLNEKFTNILIKSFKE